MTATQTAPVTPGTAGAALPVLAVDLPTDPALAGELASLARALEEAGAGAIVLTDAGLHPIHVAGAMAPATRSIGLIARTDAVHVEPFHLATQLMSLDHVSHGRAGWAITAATDPSVPAAVGREVLDGEETAQEVWDVLTASRLVWDSWTDDAVVRDLETGVYVDASRLQYADFEGETFSVRGPSITPRSPQGLLPVLVADADLEVVGPRASSAVDGRALDVDVTGLAADAAVAAVRSALERRDAGGDASGSAASGPAVARQAPAAAASAVRLVRLVGLADHGGPATWADAVRLIGGALREEGLLAPAPQAGSSLREQFGLERPEVVIDPERRSDRARLARGETSTARGETSTARGETSTARGETGPAPAPSTPSEETR